MGYGQYDDGYWEDRQLGSRWPTVTHQFTPAELADIQSIWDMGKEAFIRAFVQAEPHQENKRIPLTDVVPQTTTGMNLDGYCWATTDEGWGMHLIASSGATCYLQSECWTHDA